MFDILISYHVYTVCWALDLEIDFSWNDITRATVFAVFSAAIFLPISFYVYGGIQVYIWIIPLDWVPVIALQAIIVAIAGLFALPASWIIATAVTDMDIQLGKGSISIPGQILRLSVFLMGLIGSSLYFWNILAFLCGILLLWFGRNRLWKIMAVFSISWTLLVQIFVYLSFWR